MAYNKNNYEHQRLTPAQEKFCEEIMKGKTQRQAYYIAYPNSRNWDDNAVDSTASQLMDNPKIIQRLQEMGYRNAKEVTWTRQKALETINYVMDLNKKDLERINDAYQTEIDLLEVKLQQKGQEMVEANGDTRATIQIAAEMQAITKKIAECRKQKRTNSTNIKGIYEGAKILNRMFGYDITKVEIKQADEEREEMEKLTVDELRALISTSKEGD